MTIMDVETVLSRIAFCLIILALPAFIKLLAGLILIMLLGITFLLLMGLFIIACFCSILGMKKYNIRKFLKLLGDE